MIGTHTGTMYVHTHSILNYYFMFTCVAQNDLELLDGNHQPLQPSLQVYNPGKAHIVTILL